MWDKNVVKDKNEQELTTFLYIECYDFFDENGLYCYSGMKLKSLVYQGLDIIDEKVNEKCF